MHLRKSRMHQNEHQFDENNVGRMDQNGEFLLLIVCDSKKIVGKRSLSQRSL